MEWIKNLISPEPESHMAWFNYDTNEYDYIDIPENYAHYVPKGTARNLYYLYVEHMGWNPLDAMKDVLERCIGEK